MIVNLSEPFKNKYYNFKQCSTPIKDPKKDPNSTRSHKSFARDRHRVHAMLDLNKKYEKELINNEFNKLR